MKAVISQYYPGDSWLHRADPRAKFVAVLSLAIALFVRDSFAALAVYAAAGVLAFALAGVPGSWLWRALRPALWLIGLTFLAQVLFAPGEPFATLGPFELSVEGLRLAGFLSVRLLVLILIGSVLTLTTAPVALTDALAWLGRPLRRLRVPSDELALMVTIALRFVPTLLMELDTIMRAQRARGADFSRGGPVRRARALVPVLVPLFVVSFRRADDLALAMEARCYTPGAARTRLRPLRARPGDFVLLAVTAGVIVFASVV